MESDRPRREAGSVGRSLSTLWGEAASKPDLVISGATGVKEITAEERAALDVLTPGTPITALGDLTGHSLEVTAPLGAALAAALISEGTAREITITTVGHRRGEGVIRLSALS